MTKWSKEDLYGENSLDKNISYTYQRFNCERGGKLELMIPENPTKDDLLGIREFLNLILKRRYKMEDEDD